MVARTEERLFERRCAGCLQMFTAKQLYMNGGIVVNPQYCQPCGEKLNNATIAKATAVQRPAATPDWAAVCPPLYRDTDVAQLQIDPEVIQRVLEWLPQSRGIALSGPTGSGKTRLMMLLLFNLHLLHRVRAVTAKQFERWVHQMFEKDNYARKEIKACRHVGVLFIDDIGKEKYTERVESEFYDLVEHRTSHLLPILWTTNATGSQLEQMMGADRGIPIVRRLREFTEVISV